MLNYVIKGLINALIMFVMLNLVGALIWSLSFEGRCGFLSEACSFTKYYIDSLAWFFAISVYYGAIFFIISGLGGSILAYKFNKPIRWVYLANTIIFIVVLLFILIIDPIFDFL